MSVCKFDDSKITWHTVDWLIGFTIFVYNVDEEKRSVDLMIKFEPGEITMMHQHTADYATIVLEGELRFYDADREHYETRPAGSYVQGSKDGSPHFEGAGDERAIVLFSIRDVEDKVAEFFDDVQGVTHVLGISDFKAVYEEQLENGEIANVSARKVAVPTA
ncbi:MAG TPA: hypothetical protein VFE65_33960 [Pseudonocardia sp.]|jgi:quercetin dioxygenase-like cupin family protein|nr:hypothetical protein [Pseudonocardia sp.]